jgi:hypothetical protein
MAGRAWRVRSSALACIAPVGNGKTWIFEVGFGEEAGIGTVRSGVSPLDWVERERMDVGIKCV